jgi:uncharacterized LabA/DUF88 family protein
VNFGKILEEAAEDRHLVRALAYVIKADTPDEQKIFEALDKQGFEVKMKDLQVFPGGAKKGDWDVGITVDAIRMSQKLDTIVLVAGDGDYIPLVRYLQEAKGCKVEVVAFQESTSMKLREAADKFTDLSADKKKYLLPIRPGLRASFPRPRIFPRSGGQRPVSPAPSNIIDSPLDT